MKRELREANTATAPAAAKPQPAPNAQALEAARLRIAAAIAARNKVQALPVPEGQRVDCSPYRKAPQ